MHFRIYNVKSHCKGIISIGCATVSELFAPKSHWLQLAAGCVTGWSTGTDKETAESWDIFII